MICLFVFVIMRNNAMHIAVLMRTLKAPCVPKLVLAIFQEYLKYFMVCHKAMQRT